MSLPEKYKWLDKENAPRMIVEGLKLYGIKEAINFEDNPAILEWAKELGLGEYKHDSIAWCGLFVAIVASRAGKEVVKDPLWAANWLKFGNKVDVAMLGDVLVFFRPGGHHVGIYVGEDQKAYHILGGNQGDHVSIARIHKDRLRGIRKPIYKTVQPANVRQIFLSPTGSLSHNES